MFQFADRNMKTFKGGGSWIKRKDPVETKKISGQDSVKGQKVDSQWHVKRDLGWQG